MRVYILIFTSLMLLLSWIFQLISRDMNKTDKLNRFCVQKSNIPNSYPIFCFQQNKTYHLQKRTLENIFNNLQYPIVNIGGPVVNLSIQVFDDAGFIITNNKNSSIFNFNYGSPRNQQYYQSIQPGQMFNQIPGSFEITRKDLLMKNVQQCKKQKLYSQSKTINLSSNQFSVPKSYQIPQQLEEFINNEQLNVNNFPYNQQYNDKWFIYKPTMSSRGKNIHLFQTLNQIDHFNENINATIQEYETQPLLYEDRKVDIRMLILVTSVDPFIVYLYPEGLGRLARSKYEYPTQQNSKNDSIHLTNTALLDGFDKKINKVKLTELLEYAADVFIDRCLNPEERHKYSSSSLFCDDFLDKQLEDQNQDIINTKQIIKTNQSKYLRDEMRAKISKKLYNNIIVSIEETLIQSYSSFLSSSRKVTTNIYRFPKSFFGYYGIDILIDRDGNAKVLEINASPFLGFSSKQTSADFFKIDFLYESLNLIGIPAFFDEEYEKLFIPERNNTEIPPFVQKHVIHHEGIRNNDFDNFTDEYIKRVLAQLDDEASRQKRLIRILPDAFKNVKNTPTTLNSVCLKHIIKHKINAFSY